MTNFLLELIKKMTNKIKIKKQKIQIRNKMKNKGKIK